MLMIIQSADTHIFLLIRFLKLLTDWILFLGSLSNCIDDKMQRQKRERSGYGKKALTEERAMVLNIAHLEVFFYPLLLLLFILHFQSLLLLEFLKTKLISMNLRTDNIPAHFLNHSNIHFIQFQMIAKKD